MSNESKNNDPRFWKLWRESGAVYTIKPTTFVQVVTNELKRLYPDAEIEYVPQSEIQPRTDGTPGLAIHRRSAIRIGGQHLGTVFWGVAERGTVPEDVTSIDSLAMHPEGQLEYSIYHLDAPKPASKVLFDRTGRVTESRMYDGTTVNTIEGHVKRFLENISVAPPGGFAYR